MVSIGCLIYRSTRWAESVLESARKHTPELTTGRARFFFVANDATEDVLLWLKGRGVPHVIQNNSALTPEKLTARGIAHPEYMNRVYRGWNRAIQESDEVAVLVSSDHKFSPGWLEQLVQYVDENTVVTGVAPEPEWTEYARAIDCGKTLGAYDEDRFLSYADSVRGVGQAHEGFAGPPFQPFAFRRETVLGAGGYPEGNIGDGQSFDCIVRSGDADLFQRLEAAGVTRLQAQGSVVYHFNEGEMRGG